MTRRTPAYLLLASQLALVALVFAGPAVYTLGLAMQRTDFIASAWVGLANYRVLFAGRDFGRILANTGLYLLMITPVTVGGGALVALIAYDLPRGVRSYLRVALYLPTLTSGLIIATVWRWIWHPSAGLANWALGLVGLGPVWWLGGRLSGIFAISCNIIVGSIGFETMVIMAAILSVPTELLDAAKIDGCSPWQLRLRVVLPGIAPTVALLSTLSLLGIAQMWETVMMTTNGGPDHGTATLMFDIYETGFLAGRFGLGAAKTVVLVALVVGLALVKRKVETWAD